MSMKILMTNEIYVSMKEATLLTGLNRGVILRAIDAGYIQDKGIQGRHKINLSDLYKFCEVLHTGCDGFRDDVMLFPMKTIEHFILYRYIH